MLYLNVGNTWDFEYLEELNKLNISNSNIKIKELYGSLDNSPIASARPKFRIPKRNNKFLKEYIEKASENNIDINYTLNTMCIGSKSDLKKNEIKLLNYVEDLILYGVARLTIAHPLLIKIIHETFPNVPIELSTVSPIESITQLYDYIELGIDKICMNINKNRDFAFLKMINKHAIDNNIIIELLANEFCIFNCIHRNYCFLIHSHSDKNEKEIYNNYPFNECIEYRNKKPYEWLKTRFIRPEDMQRYNDETNINYFKITGRTFPTKVVLPIVTAYMNEMYEGNLLDLWCHLENIGDENNYKSNETVYIPNHEMNDFLDVWINKKCYNSRCDASFDCNRFCHGCNYCENYYNEIIKRKEL